jgi:serine/threonine-protein kinase
VGVLFYEMLSGELPSATESLSVQSYHPDLDASHDALLRRFLAAAPSDRFSSALEARRAVEMLSWSTRQGRRVLSAPVTTDRAVVADASQRAVPPQRGGDRHDVWLGRDVHCVAYDQGFDTAAQFARADHPTLATVFRVDQTDNTIWVEVMKGRPLSQGLTLEPRQVAALREGVLALHRAGGHHGSIDAAHVFVEGAEVRLAFPKERAAFEELALAQAVDDQAISKLG